MLYVLNRLCQQHLRRRHRDKDRRRARSRCTIRRRRAIREGRGFLFDAKLSGNGTVACAACHIDGRHDGLAWDLGDPGGQLFNNGLQKLHPMKGPLLTQTLQGMKGERIFHWRADRPGLGAFNPAFDVLMGGSQLNATDLATFVAYMEEIRFMPNPNRNDDDTLPTSPIGASAKDGETIFKTKNNVGKNGSNQFRCNDCHFNASGTGAFGFDGLIGQQTEGSAAARPLQTHGQASRRRADAPPDSGSAPTVRQGRSFGVRVVDGAVQSADRERESQPSSGSCSRSALGSLPPWASRGP